MYEQPEIPEEHLRACLQDQYNLVPITLDFLPLGLDSNAAVYRVENEQGTPYLLKVKSGLLYEPGYLVPRYLSDQGITSVVAPLPTRSNALWTRLENWTALVYPFIDGDTSWAGMTDEHWKETGSIFKQIHEVILPHSGFASLRKEIFDAAEYARWIHEFEAQHVHHQADGSMPERALRSSWIAHQPTISMAVASLEKLARVLQGRNLPYVICHADLHPANLLRDLAGHVFVIDWDEVMLAPKERDFIFVKEAPVDDAAGSSTPPFFQGYGQTDIDWIVLTYYRYERVVQDLIACAQEVFFRDDLGEESKTNAVQLFQGILAEGGEIEAAIAAAVHLPPDLTVHNPD